MRRLLPAVAAALVLFGAPGVQVHAAAASPATSSLASMAADNPNLTIFVRALGATGLSGLVDGCNDTHTTVLAPTDDAFRSAFRAYGMSVDEALDDTKLLGDLLTYHVLPGDVDAATIAAADTVATVRGTPLTVVREGDAIRLNGEARLTTTDLTACNGMLHTVDRVLFAPGTAPTEPSFPVTGLWRTELLVEVAGGAAVAGVLAMLVARRPRRRLG